MSKINTLVALLRDRRLSGKTAALKIAKSKIFHILPDKIYLKLFTRLYMGIKLNIENPATFNEKIQWLKLYDRRPEYTDMVDKYKVRDFVAQTIGEEYLIPLLGVWNSFDEIDFSKLPDQFVLKCTHDSGSVVICEDKASFDFAAAKKRLETCLKRNLFYYGREWPYKNVVPRIIAEAYMQDETESALLDYKFMCFNGKVQCTFVCSERFSAEGLKITIYDKDWIPLPFERDHPRSTKLFPKPLNYSRMVELAEILSKGTSFLRVDFYEINKRIYFGELTFYPGSGVIKFQPNEWDRKLGDMITLPTKGI